MKKAERTLNSCDTVRIAEVALNSNLDVRQGWEPDGREDVILGTLGKQDRRICRVVACGKCRDQRRSIVQAISVWHSERGPCRDARHE